jgi:hypothetical protein
MEKLLLLEFERPLAGEISPSINVTQKVAAK